jgi:hypothetical protein
MSTFLTPTTLTTLMGFNALPPRPADAVSYLEGKVYIASNDLDTLVANLWNLPIGGTAIPHIDRWIPKPTELESTDTATITRAISLWDSFELPYDLGLNTSTAFLTLLQENRLTSKGAIDLSTHTLRCRRAAYKSAKSFWSSITAAKKNLPHGDAVLVDSFGEPYRAFTFPYVKDTVAHLIDEIGLQGWYSTQVSPDKVKGFKTAELIHDHVLRTLAPRGPLVGEYHSLNYDAMHNVASFANLLVTTLVMLPIVNRHDAVLAHDLARLTAQWPTFDSSKVEPPENSTAKRNAEKLWTAYVLRRVLALFEEVKDSPFYEACIEAAQFRVRLLTVKERSKSDKLASIILPYICTKDGKSFN